MLSFIKIILVVMVLNYALTEVASSGEEVNRLPFDVMKTIFDFKTANKFQSIPKNELKKLFKANRNFNVQTSKKTFFFL